MSEEKETEQPMTAEPTAPPVEEDFKDKYFRLLAETENARKRMIREKQDAMRFAIENVLADIISPMESLENALKFADQMPGEVKNWAMGFQMILSQFKDVLQQHGVVPYSSEGKIFDANLHEAVETEETDSVPEGTIIQEFIRGYRCGDRVIRPSRVKVAKKIKKGDQ